MNSILSYVEEVLREKGMDKFQCVLSTGKEYEMNMEGLEFTLIRTVTDHTLAITVIKDNRKGAIALNSLEKDAVDEALDTVLDLLSTSDQDPDYDIAPYQEPQEFSAGARSPGAGTHV